MSLKSFFFPDRASALAKKSSNIMNVFTTTLNRLSEANEEIQSAKAKNVQKISTLHAQNATLDATLTNNQTVIENINRIFQPLT